jgi:NADPH-dependent ferric siderophore reductase
VRRIEVLGPGFVALTFGGEAFSDFVSLSFDDHVKLFFDDGQGEPARRDYTPRRFDPATKELTIEFALHGESRTCRWARSARVGQQAIIGGPKSSMVIPTDIDWHLLVGDATALPGVHRRLDELPEGSRAIVVLQVSAHDRRVFDSRARVDLHWVDRPDDLIAVVRTLQLPSGDGYGWAAGEATVMASVRRILAEEKGLPKEALRVASYWKRGLSADHGEPE